MKLPSIPLGPRRFTLLGTVLVIAVAGFWVAKALDAAGGDAARGHALYTDHCMVCHGVAGDGDGVLAAEMPVTMPDISTKVHGLFEFNAFLINSVILPGKPDAGMPGFDGVLTYQDSHDILTYVRSFRMDG